MLISSVVDVAIVVRDAEVGSTLFAREAEADSTLFDLHEKVYVAYIFLLLGHYFFSALELLDVSQSINNIHFSSLSIYLSSI